MLSHNLNPVLGFLVDLVWGTLILTGSTLTLGVGVTIFWSLKDFLRRDLKTDLQFVVPLCWIYPAGLILCGELEGF